VRSLIIGGVLLIILLLCGIVATFAQQFQCYPLEGVLAKEEAEGRSFFLAEGWLGGALVRLHQDEAPFFYTLPSPSSSVLLTFDEGGNVLLGLVILMPDGVKVCAPLKFPAREWSKVVLMLRGRGA
jgi:hypothetical protein